MLFSFAFVLYFLALYVYGIKLKKTIKKTLALVNGYVYLPGNIL